MAPPRKRGRPRKETIIENAVTEPVSKADKPVSKPKTAAKKPATKKTAQNKTTAKKVKYTEQGNLIFAMDIGTRTIVGILGEEINDVFYLRDYEVVPHSKRAMVDGQVEDIEQVAKIAKQVKNNLEERNHIRLTEVSVAAAGRALKTRRVSMDFNVEDKDNLTEEMIKSMEVETIQKAQAELDAKFAQQETLFYCVGHSVVQYSLDDYKIITLLGHKGAKATIDLIAAFLPNVVVEGLYAVMDKVGLDVKSMTLEPIAAMNVIIPPEIRLINIALVDIGAGTSDIAIARDGAIVAYAMATTAGDEISEEIIRSFFVDFNTAEQMKIDCSSGNDEITFKDIFGLQHTVTSAEIFEKISSAVDVLAETICASVVEANGKSPAAVFLIGGGSLANGLTKLISDKLSIDESRVAVGGHEFLKNVNTEGHHMGPEFVTPLGIGVTASLNQGYDFSVISLNDEKIRIFDTKQLSVFELLSIAGYKSAQILGHSGRSLTYSYNGEKRTVKGSMQTPAEIYVNEKLAAVTTKVTQGDKVTLIPAKNGENAKVYISDIVNPNYLTKGKVNFGGAVHEIGLSLFANNLPVSENYEIQPLDEIEVNGVQTLGDLLKSLDVELTEMNLSIGGIKVNNNYVLKDGDDIKYGDETAIPASIADVIIKKSQPIMSAVSVKPVEKSNTISVMLNGKHLDLPERESPYLIADLLVLAEIDIEHLSGALVLTLNGLQAKFTDQVKDFSVVTISQEEN